MKRKISAVIAAAAVLLCLTPTPALAASDLVPTAKPTADTSEFRGVNWADPRDNYADDEVVPSGLSTLDDYATTYSKSTAIVAEFKRELRANTVRLPINPSSVGTEWWNSYRAAIDASVGKGFKVILSYWEADDAKDGLVDDDAAFDAMWDTVVSEYGENPRVYFEIMNEPFGYSLDEWVSLTSGWLDDHSEVPRKRVIISGTGYNDHVDGVGAAPQLAGTLLSLHFYGFWASDTTEEAWKANLLPRLGPYAWRTVITEAGSPMTTGLNYGNHEDNVSTAYLGALTEIARDSGMGTVYWPGLRTGDSYSLTEQDAHGGLTVTNASGLAQLQWGWGLLKQEQLNDLPPAPPGSPIRSVAHDVCIDVPGASTTAGTRLGLWNCNGGENQSFDWTDTGELRIYGSKCVAGAPGIAAGSALQILECSGGEDQRWSVNDDRTISSAVDPALCLSTPADSWALVVAACDPTDPNHQWVYTG